MTFDPKIARSIDLIQLPADIPGKSCATCDFFDPESDFCDHPKIDMNVRPHEACREWHNERAKPVTHRKD